MNHEIDPSALPLSIQASMQNKERQREDFFELSAKLRESCVNILSEYGQPREANYRDRISRISKWLSLGLSKDESTKSTAFHEVMAIKGGDFLSVFIMSFGSKPPKDARYVSVYVSAIDRDNQLVVSKDINTKVALWRARGPEKHIRAADRRDVIQFFEAVDFLEKELQKDRLIKP